MDYSLTDIHYGIGISEIKEEIDKSKNHLDKIDFLISTNKEKEIYIESPCRFQNDL